MGMNKRETASFFLQGMEKDLKDILGDSAVRLTEEENPKIGWRDGKNGAKFTLEVIVKDDI